MVAAVLFGSGRSYAQGDVLTLADVLSDCDCVVPGMPATLLQKPVAAFERLVDATGFVVAFWTYPPEHPGAVDVVAGNVQARQWKHVELPVDHDSSDPRRQGGPIWKIWRAHPFTLVGLRVSIDGIATSILTADLTRVGVTYGVVHGAFPNGIMLYEHAQRHFAPTHSVRLAALDTIRGVERDVYPVKPFDRVRRAIIRQEHARYAALGERWCRESNHHCDPERFNSDMAWPATVIVNGRTKAAAFRVEYGDGVIVVCTGIDHLQTIVCRESSVLAWRRAFPKDDDTQLLRRAAADPTRVRW